LATSYLKKSYISERVSKLIDDYCAKSLKVIPSTQFLRQTHPFADPHPSGLVSDPFGADLDFGDIQLQQHSVVDDSELVSQITA
jgi:hypothetical protein